jgi:lipoprotein signal peptidase
MTRDRYVFVGFLALFLSANAILVANGSLALDWDGIGVMVAVGCTLALYSFLYKDNALFKVAEHVYVGVAAAYVFGITWYNSLYGEIIVSYFDIGAEGSTGGGHNPWVLLFPTLLGLLMLTRFSRKFSWLSRISFAFVVGVGAGLTIPRFMSSFLLGQLEPSLAPLSLSWEGLNLFLVLVGVITVLVYFFFSVEHKGVVGHASRLGIWFLMVSFGASFGYTIMARLSLLIGRISFLLDDWLHVM